MNLRHYGNAGHQRGLVLTGALINVTVAAPKVEGLPQVPPIPRVPMMVDTGADLTLLDNELCQKLGAPPLRFQEIAGVNSVEACPVYRLGISVGMSQGSVEKAERGEGLIVNVRFDAEIVGMPNSPAGHRGLLGRDFLAMFHLEYHGPAGRFELVWKDPPIDHLPPEFRTASRKRKRKRKK